MAALKDSPKTFSPCSSLTSWGGASCCSAGRAGCCPSSSSPTEASSCYLRRPSASSSWPNKDKWELMILSQIPLLLTIIIMVDSEPPMAMLGCWCWYWGWPHPWSSPVGGGASLAWEAPIMATRTRTETVMIECIFKEIQDLKSRRWWKYLWRDSSNEYLLQVTECVWHLL